jgi:hypothetical protein
MLSHNDHRGIQCARISAVERPDYFLRMRGSNLVVSALVANTMVFRPLYNY